MRRLKIWNGIGIGLQIWLDCAIEDNNDNDDENDDDDDDECEDGIIWRSW